MAGRTFRLLLLCSAVVAAVSALAAPESPRSLGDAYLDALLHDDWPAARALWSPEDLAASRRLGIRYEGQPLKVDSASLLVLEHARVRSGEIRVSVDRIETDGDLAHILYRLEAPDGVGEARSFALRGENGWRFVSAPRARCADWSVRRTEFLDLRVQPPLRISEEAVQVLDDFVAATCVRLALPPERVDLLRREKLGYLFCDEATVADIVGAPTRGAALLQTDAVVTSEPCHLHEVAHLLVNFALRELPLYTLPFMQEGAAVAFGGRWGRSPEVMSGLGRFALGEGLLTVDELLTRDDFYSNSADLTYAPSGVFTDFLIDRIGGDGYLDLYLALSGDWAEMAGLDAATVRARICRTVGAEWVALTADLDAYVDRLSCGGVLVGESPGPEIIAVAARGALALQVTGDDERLHWRVEAETGPTVGAVLFRGRADAPIAGRLFAEQFPTRERSREILAVVFSPDEIGVYDFRSDLLRAKYVAGFCPEQEVASVEGGRLEFTLRRDLFPEGEWDLEIVSLEP